MRKITSDSCWGTNNFATGKKLEILEESLFSKLRLVLVIAVLFIGSSDLYAQLNCEHTPENFVTSDPSCPESEQYDIAKIDREVIGDEIFYVKVSGSACCGNFLVNPKSGNQCFYDTNIAGPSGPDVVIQEVGTVPDTCGLGDLTKCSESFNDVIEFTCSDGSTVGHRITFLGSVENGTDSYWYYRVENGVNSCISDISHIAFGVVDTDVCCVDGVADELDDVTACDSYTLPALSAGNQYWTATGGTGEQLSAGDVITTDQTIYIYAPATAPCVADQSEFVVVINDSPEAVELDDVTACDSYTLPALSAGNQYWTATGGTGEQLSAGDVITTDQTIYIYAPATAPCVADQSEFVVVINDSPEAVELDDVTACDSYTLPALSAGNQYWTATGGTGEQLSAGDVITTDQTIYIYAPATAPCVADQSSFIITIEDTPAVPQYQVTQADCLGGNGSLVFIDAANDLYYSIDGGAFVRYTGEISLGVDTYEFRIRYGEDGCVSAEFDVSINRPSESVINIPTEITQPDCETLLGAVIITNPDLSPDLNFTVTHLGSGTIYYSDVAYPAGGFTGLPVGSYRIAAISDNGCESGNATVHLVEPVCPEFTGCTLGYWKNHTDRWCSEYQTCTAYGDVFENAPEELADLTLLEVLNLGGGGIYNLGRQSVAALLNACSDEVDYELETPAAVIEYVNANFNNAGAAGSYLDMLNNAGCTLGGSKATTEPSEGCVDEADSGNDDNGDNKAKVASSVNIYPVPFKETINLQYQMDYISDVVIQIFDMRGNHLRTYTDINAGMGSVTSKRVDFAIQANQIYVLKVITDRETIVKQIVSSKK